MDWGDRIGAQPEGPQTPRDPPAAEEPARAPDPAAATIVALGDRAVGEHVGGWPKPNGASAFAASALTNIVFGRDGNANGATREGWSVPEPGYLWTLGHRSTLVLPPPRVEGPHEVQIQLAPFVHPGKIETQRLDLEVNGARLGALKIAEQAVLSVALPAALLAGRESIELAFTLPDAARPDEVSGLADDRVLGFSFRQLVMRPVASAPGQFPSPRVPAEPVVASAMKTEAAEAADMPARELMLQFESLGENCEFGLVQRQFGAEPLGLLRFASAPREKLLRALRARFAAFGAPGSIVVDLSDKGEFMVQDLAFGIYYHAWVKAGEQTAENIHAREARRVPFLVRKLVEDLTEAEKIFVYHGMDPLSEDEAREIVAAIRLYGPGTLLWVELADAEHPAGSVQHVGEGLLKGFIDRFAPGENAHDFSVVGWAAVCRNALRIGGNGKL